MDTMRRDVLSCMASAIALVLVLLNRRPCKTQEFRSDIGVGDSYVCEIKRSNGDCCETRKSGDWASSLKAGCCLLDSLLLLLFHVC